MKLQFACSRRSCALLALLPLVVLCIVQMRWGDRSAREPALEIGAAMSGTGASSTSLRVEGQRRDLVERVAEPGAEGHLADLSIEESVLGLLLEVVDRDGNPVREVQAQLSLDASDAPEPVVRFDGQKHFSKVQFPARLAVEAQGFVARRVRFSARPPLGRVRPQLWPREQIVGRVIGPDGRPMMGVRIAAWPALTVRPSGEVLRGVPGPGAKWFSCTSDEHGEFELLGMPRDQSIGLIAAGQGHASEQILTVPGLPGAPIELHVQPLYGWIARGPRASEACLMAERITSGLSPEPEFKRRWKSLPPESPQAQLLNWPAGWMLIPSGPSDIGTAQVAPQPLAGLYVLRADRPDSALPLEPLDGGAALEVRTGLRLYALQSELPIQDLPADLLPQQGCGSVVIWLRNEPITETTKPATPQAELLLWPESSQYPGQAPLLTFGLKSLSAHPQAVRAVPRGTYRWQVRSANGRARWPRTGEPDRLVIADEPVQLPLDASWYGALEIAAYTHDNHEYDGALWLTLGEGEPTYDPQGQHEFSGARPWPSSAAPTSFRC